MEEGGKFETRHVFSAGLRSWSNDTGLEENHYARVHDNGASVHYKCLKSNHTNIEISIGRRSVPSPDGKGKRRKTAKGCPCTITKWEPCLCEIEKKTKQGAVLPVVGRKIMTRAQYTDMVNNYCRCNHKPRYIRVNNSCKAERRCRKTGCPGKVVASLTLQNKNGRHIYVGPLTVTESVECSPGCASLEDETTQECVICKDTMHMSEFTSELCCKMASAVCYSCLVEGYLVQRPTHESRKNWPGKKSLKNKIMCVGTGESELWPKCPVLECIWPRDKSFLYKCRRIPILKFLPFGFDGEEPVHDQVLYERKYQELQKKISLDPSMVDAIDVEEGTANALDVVLGELRDLSGETPVETNNLRRALVLLNRPAASTENPDNYLRQVGLLEIESVPVVNNADDPIVIE
jgi:hypothetical protein